MVFSPFLEKKLNIERVTVMTHVLTFQVFFSSFIDIIDTVSLMQTK